MKFICKKCGKEVQILTVLKTYQLRDDYVLIKINTTSSYQRVDREYFYGKVDKIIATCEDCGDIQITSDNIQHFVRDIDKLQDSDILDEQYDSIKVIK